MDHRLGQSGKLKQIFDDLLKKKPNEGSPKSFWGFLKNLTQKYKNTGNEVKILHIERDCSYMILEDNSQWRLAYTFEPRQIYWSRGENVIVYHGRDRGRLFNIRNLSMGEDVEWKFHGYLEE